MNKRLISMVLFFLVGGLTLYFFVFSNNTTVPSAPPEPLRLALDPWPGSAHVFLADKKGIFANNGVAVQLKLFKGPDDSMTAFKNGDVDGVVSGVYSDVIQLKPLEHPVKIVYVTDYSQSGDVIIARPEFTSLAELKGHTVSFERLNSFSHIFVLRALEAQGLNETNVKFKLVLAPDVLRALEEQKIDAGHTWQPTSSQALAKGYKILAKAGDFPGIITDVSFVSAKIIRERPTDVRAFVRSMVQARDYLADHREESLAIMAKGTGMSVEELSAGLAESKPATLQDNITAFDHSDSPYSLFHSGEMIIKFLLKRGVLQSVPDLNELLDGRFVQDIQKGHSR